MIAHKEIERAPMALYCFVAEDMGEVVRRVAGHQG